MLYIELEHGDTRDRIFVISTIELVGNNHKKYLRKYLPEYHGETARYYSPSTFIFPQFCRRRRALDLFFYSRSYGAGQPVGSWVRNCALF
jgi:hypothetical protein